MDNLLKVLYEVVCIMLKTQRHYSLGARYFPSKVVYQRLQQSETVSLKDMHGGHGGESFGAYHQSHIKRLYVYGSGGL